MINNLKKEEKGLSGVYIIKNLINNKVYIGSTVRTLEKRCWEHTRELKLNIHKNSHLQNSYNKHGGDNFQFLCLEVVEKSKCLEKEQYYMDFYNVYDNTKGYNINPFASGTPTMSKELIEKRSETYRKTVSEASKWYHKFKLGEITMDEVPEKFQKLVKRYSSVVSNDGQFTSGIIPWNKGKKFKNTDHLKVPKKYKSEEHKKETYLTRSKILREKCPKVYVYDLSQNFLGVWNSSKDLEEWSLTEENNLPINGRFSSERMNKPKKLLMSCNINKCCNNLKESYKGLLFSNLPLHQEIDVE